jgi:hypothetical protein
VSQHQVRTIVALTVIFGHIGVLLVGFFLLGIFSGPFSSDTLQIILLTSPVLAATAVAAIKYVLNREIAGSPGEIVDGAFAAVAIGIPLMLIAAIFFLFIITYYRVSGFSLDSLKISLGFLETAFMGFMAAISDRLFGAPRNSNRRRPRPNRQ